MSSFEWFFQGLKEKTGEQHTCDILMGLRIDDHDSQASFTLEVNSERLSMFLSAIHDIVNYNRDDYNQRRAVLKTYSGADVTVTGLLCESERGMSVSGFTCSIMMPLYGFTATYSFDLYDTKDMLRFCHDGWDTINRVKGNE